MRSVTGVGGAPSGLDGRDVEEAAPPDSMRTGGGWPADAAQVMPLRGINRAEEDRRDAVDAEERPTVAEHLDHVRRTLARPTRTRDALRRRPMAAAASMS